MRKNKLKSFTLLELLIAMLLSTVVAGIAYTVYSMTSSGFYKARVINESSSKEFYFRSKMALAIDKSDEILFKGDTLFISHEGLLSKSYPLDTVFIFNKYDTIDVNVINSKYKMGINDYTIEVSYMIKGVTSDTVYMSFLKDLPADYFF